MDGAALEDVAPAPAPAPAGEQDASALPRESSVLASLSIPNSLVRDSAESSADDLQPHETASGRALVDPRFVPPWKVDAALKSEASSSATTSETSGKAHTIISLGPVSRSHEQPQSAPQSGPNPQARGAESRRGPGRAARMWNPGGGPKSRSGAQSLRGVPASSVRDAQEASGSVSDSGGAFFPAGGLVTQGRPASGPSRPVPPEEALIGKVLDQRYRIDARIGSGGMGIVYRGTHVIIDKPLALKVLRAEHASQTEVVKRFLLEAQLASQIKHPNVVDISDYGQVSGTKLAYYVMEYLSGTTLAYRIDNSGPLDPRDAIDIAIQTASALGAAHGRGIVHRDLKPDNIFLCAAPDARGTLVKILDFGIARARYRKTRLTASGVVVGTPAYMSPEQARGGEVDGRSDLYTLGVILFEMITGTVPFEARSTLEALNQHVYEVPPEVRDINPQLPPLENLERLIRQLLAKNPSERPRDAALTIKLLIHARDHDLKALPARAPGKRHTVNLGSGSMVGRQVDPEGDAEGETGDNATAGGEGAVQPRTFGISERYKRKRPSVIVRNERAVQRIAPPAARAHTPAPTTGGARRVGQDAKPSESPVVRSSPLSASASVDAVRSGPPAILLVVVAAIVGAAVTLGVVKYLKGQETPPAPPATGLESSATPAAQPALETVRITFDSRPPDLEVVAPDGRVLGNTPFEQVLPADPSPTQFEFRAADGSSVTQTVILDVSKRVVAELEGGAKSPASPAAGASERDASVEAPEPETRSPARRAGQSAPKPSPDGDAEAKPGTDLGELRSPFEP